MGTMREILFRGKTIYNGVWAESVCPLGVMRAGHLCDDFDPATVGQYTGLTANGKRIFEGDIVNGLFLFERPIAGVVTFRDGSFGVQWMRGRVEEFSVFTSCCNVAWEVIGNVADNPELLEGGVNDG